jgi:hypothetical protein
MKEQQVDAPRELSVAVAKEQFLVLAWDSPRIRDLLSTNIGRGGLNVFDLDQIHVPTAGTTQWQLEDLHGIQNVPSFEAIIIDYVDPRNYWKDNYGDNGGNKPPDCTSPDGQIGHGHPGGQCALCPMAEFGSATDGSGKQRRGQACKQTRNLFCILPAQIIPVAVVLPPTSLKASRKFFLRLASMQITFSSIVTAFELERDRNADGIAYSRAVLKIARPLSPEESRRIEAYAATIRPLLDRARLTEGRE